MNHETIVDAQKEIGEYVGDKGLNVLFNSAGQIQGKGFFFSVIKAFFFQLLSF